MGHPVGSGEWLNEKQEQIRQNPLCSLCCCAVFITIFITIVTLFGCSFRTIGPYHYGLLLNTATKSVFLDKGANSVYEPGVYFVGFWNKFLEFPATIQTIQYSFDNPEEGVQHIKPLYLRSKDLNPMHLEVSVQYQRKKEELVQFFRKAMTPNLQENLIISVLRAELTKIMSNYDATECWTNRRQVVADFHKACQKVLAKVHVSCWGLQFYRVGIREEMETALVNTQVQKQQERIEYAKRQAAEVRSLTGIVLNRVIGNITVFKSQQAAQRYRIQVSTATQAEANKVLAEANITRLVLSSVQLANGSAMTGEQLVVYQKALALGNDLMSAPLFHGFTDQDPSYIAAPNAQQANRRLAELLPPPEQVPELGGAAAAVTLAGHLPQQPEL